MTFHRLYPPQDAVDGEWTDWVQPVKEGYKMACCDCKLVHVLDFRIEEDRVQFRVRRDNRSTSQLRRHRGVTVT